MSLVLSGDGSVGPLSATEVGYLDGVTSAVQTQIDGKAATPTWQTITPSFNNFAIGNGSVVGRLAQIGSVYIYTGRIIIGSTSSFSGNIQVNAPTAVNNGFATFHNGTAVYADIGSRTHIGLAVYEAADYFSLVHSETGNGGYVNATNPFTFATSDRIAWSVIYG